MERDVLEELGCWLALVKGLDAAVRAWVKEDVVVPEATERIGCVVEDRTVENTGSSGAVGVDIMMIIYF